MNLPVWAIVIGGLFGFVITLVWWIFRKTTQPSAVTSEAPVASASAGGATALDPAGEPWEENVEGTNDN